MKSMKPNLKPNAKLIPILFLILFSLTSSAREVIPDDDGPEQQEEVMPNMPEGAPPSITAPNPPPIAPVVKPPPGAVTFQPPAAGPKWTPSDYSNQKQSLGWTPDVFKVPPSMEDRVEFWK